MMTGEILFATPVPLRLVSPSKIREGPGLDSRVLFTLQEGSELVGYSYRGLWVRVGSEDSRVGWVYYSLIAGR